MADEGSFNSGDSYDDLGAGLTDASTAILAAQASGSMSIRHSNNELLKQDLDGIVLKIGVIENPTQPARTYGSNPLRTDNVINSYNHKVCLTVQGINGGYVQPGAPTLKTSKYDAQNPEDRTASEMYTNSIQEIVPLTYPIMWTSPSNWMGINYYPPVGAQVIVGFGRNQLPYILGYLNPRESTCKPVLRPGEICVKGYGNNYICFRNSNKLDIMVSANEGDPDLDDAYTDKTADQSSNCYIRLDADNGFISLGVGKNQIFITNDGITFSSEGASVIGMTPTGINLSTAQYNVAAQGETHQGNNGINC